MPVQLFTLEQLCGLAASAVVFLPQLLQDISGHITTTLSLQH